MMSQRPALRGPPEALLLHYRPAGPGARRGGRNPPERAQGGQFSAAAGGGRARRGGKAHPRARPRSRKAVAGRWRAMAAGVAAVGGGARGWGFSSAFSSAGRGRGRAGDEAEWVLPKYQELVGRCHVEAVLVLSLFFSRAHAWPRRPPARAHPPRPSSAPPLALPARAPRRRGGAARPRGASVLGVLAVVVLPRALGGRPARPRRPRRP